MKLPRALVAVLLIAVFLVAACRPAPAASEASNATPTVAVPSPAAESMPAAGNGPPAASLPAATRVGADYVLLLPRESAVPAGWQFSPPPDFQTRRPQAGDTYRFACLDLPARSIGAASVGYRSLEGLPSVHIEYVIYLSADDAAAALDDMFQATQACRDFEIGQGQGTTAASFETLTLPPYGEDGFAVVLSTSSAGTGALQTHVVKVRHGHVVIGISQTGYADDAPPDAALTESLLATAVNNLETNPSAP